MESYQAAIAAKLGKNRPDWYVYPSVDSTNTVCRRLAAEGAPEGTVVIAHGQTAGRGRCGRSFQSRPGLGLYLSILWRPPLEEGALLALPALAAVAACRAVEHTCGLCPQIKWPNDLVIDGKKIAGILCESAVEQQAIAVVLGIGINVSHTAADFEAGVGAFAASLEMVLHRAVDRATLAAALIEELDALRPRLAEPAAWLEAYRAACLTVGREVTVLRQGERRSALALAVDDGLGLTVRWPDGQTETLRAGEVSVRGLYDYT